MPIIALPAVDVSELGDLGTEDRGGAGDPRDTLVLPASHGVMPPNGNGKRPRRKWAPMDQQVLPGAAAGSAEEARPERTRLPLPLRHFLCSVALTVAVIAGAGLLSLLEKH
jgi:hypothetical protein